MAAEETKMWMMTMIMDYKDKLESAEYLRKNKIRALKSKVKELRTVNNSIKKYKIIIKDLDIIASAEDWKV